MAGRSKYSEETKAQAFVLLTTNAGNIKRTARELGNTIPVPTLRRWRDEWEKDGPPDTSMVEEAKGEWLDTAISLRDDAAEVTKAKLALLKEEPDKVKIGEMSTLMGVLTDKINMLTGLATSRVEHQHSLPSADEVRGLMAGFVDGMKELSAARDAEIIEAEIVEQAALPRGK